MWKVQGLEDILVSGGRRAREGLRLRDMLPVGPAVESGHVGLIIRIASRLGHVHIVVAE